MEKKLKRLSVIIAVSLVVLLVVVFTMGERISQFMSGFVTGLSFTLIAGFAIYLWAKFKNK